MRVKVLFLMLLSVLIFSSSLFANTRATQLPDVDAIIDALDRLYRADHSYAEIEMKVINPNWKRTISMQVWAQGLEKTFIRILSPQRDRGIATLRNDKEMWNYFPKIDKVMKIPPSMMMGSWMGSDFTNDDLVKESSRKRDYKATLIVPPKSNKKYYYIEQIPNEKTATVWGKIISVVKKDDLIPIREEYYDEHGEKMRVINFKDVKELGGRKIPTVMELVPLKKKGKKTIVKYNELNFSKGGNSKTYTLRNLQKKI